MKKVIFCLLVVAFYINCFALPVSAQEPRDMLLSRTVEVLDNGDSIVTELYLDAVQPRTGTKGYKTSTYRANGVAVWDVTVNGAFTYNYGVSSTATGASATVVIHNSKAEFVSKNAYTSGNTATATATVAYNSVTTTRSVSVSCDKYGNLF